MIVSLHWLKQFVKLPDDVDPQELVRKLVMHAVEVDKWWRQDAYLDHVVVGRVLTANSHPGADKLKVCRVYDGKDELQVVCGGTNVREGMKCAFARIGAKVKWHGDEEMVLAKVNIRGKESHGMICAAEELGLALGHEQEREIMDLGGVDAEVGTPLAKALRADDVFIEIDNKAINHRPDLWGHLGVARELSAIYHKPFAVPEPPKLSGGRPWALKVHIEAGKLCPRYQAVVVENVQVRPSPDWMQRRLRACGIRPINNVVDVTNWVMMELGQPMHAFDVGRLTPPSPPLVRGGQRGDAVAIHVRHAKRGEKLFALDGQTYSLKEDMLIIADNKRPVAVAGVIGGEKTGTSEKTHTILFESANFNALSVRKTAQALWTRTESSARFEKMLDPTLTSLALARAVQLLRELSPDCAVASPVADVGTWRLPSASIKLSVEKTQAVLGVNIPAAKIKSILQEIGCSVRSGGKTYTVHVPTWRATRDLLLPEDLIEEVGRLYGYEHVDPVLPKMTSAPPAQDPVRALGWQLRDLLVQGLAYNEVLRYASVPDRVLALLGESTKHAVELANPMAPDERYLRTSLVPNLLTRLEQELHTRSNVQIFEIGKVFVNDGRGPHADHRSNTQLPTQDTWLTVAGAGRAGGTPFFAMRIVVELLEARTNNTWQLRDEAVPLPWAHPSRRAAVIVDDVRVGWNAELKPAVGRALGITGRVGMLGFNLTALAAIITPRKRYQPLPSHPAVERDIAFVIDRTITHDEIVAAIRHASALITVVELFDVFEGKNIPAGKKSMAFHVTYYAAGKTLTAEEVGKEHVAVERAVKKLGGEIR